MVDFESIQMRYGAILAVAFVILVLVVAVVPSGFLAAGQTSKIGSSPNVQIQKYYQLTAEVTDLGKVETSGTSVGIECGSSWWTDCSESYTADPIKTVTLDATPKGGSTFIKWGGACSGNSPTCTITMNSNKWINATFIGGETKALGVSALLGSVTSSPSGINCVNKNSGPNCYVNYPIYEQIVLTATPSPGYIFGTWSGACTSTSPTCTVYLADDTSAAAVFTKFKVSVAPSPTQPKVGDKVTFNAVAGDPWTPAITEIRIYVDNSASPKKVCTFTNGKKVSVTCVYSTSSLKEGSHTYFATAKNAEGKSVSSGTKTLTVTK